MSVWICVAPGPSAPSSLRRARSAEPEATIITCNSGAKLIRPDWYFLSDRNACREWAVVARAYQRLGTRLVTLGRLQSALAERDVEHFDRFVPLSDLPSYAFNFSGAFCVEWASLQARRVLLVGHDGYRSTKSGPTCVDYYDQRHGTPGQAEQTRDVLAPLLRKIADNAPDVEFRQYGRPWYRIDSPNWTVIE